MNQKTKDMLNAKEKAAIAKEISLYPKVQAACIDALKIVQKHRGWISDKAIEDIALELNMPVEEVDSVATFYSRIYRKPVGRNIILICDSVCCMIMGYEGIYKYLNRKLSIGYGETTPDSRFTLLPVSCLGDCNHAPSIMINDDLYHDLSTDKLDAILENYM